MARAQKTLSTALTLAKHLYFFFNMNGLVLEVCNGGDALVLKRLVLEMCDGNALVMHWYRRDW
jgi:phosphoribosylformylglycinamidine (FGAM) synthase-like amidotransferase family enzyme